MGCGRAEAPAGTLRRLLPLGFHAGARAAAALLALPAAALLARRSDPATLGLFAMALSLQGYVAQLAEGGIRSAQLALAGRDPAAARAATRRCVLLRHALGFGFGLPVLALAPLLAPGAAGALAITLLAISAQALRMDWAAIAAGRHGEAVLAQLARPLAWLLLLAAVPGNHGPAGLAALWVTAWAAAAAVSWPALRHLPRVPERTAPSSAEILRLALPAGLSAVLRQGLIGLDAWLVGLLLGAAVAGPYWLAGSLAATALIGANAAHQLALATLARRRTGAALRAELAPVVLAGTAAAGALALAGPLLVPLLLGPSWSASAALLPAFAPWVLVAHPVAVLQAAAISRSRPKLLLAADGAALGAGGAALVVAAITAEPAAFALARGAADLARLAVLGSLLLRGVRPQAGSATGSAAATAPRVPSPTRSSTTSSGGRAKRSGRPVVPTPAVTSR